MFLSTEWFKTHYIIMELCTYDLGSVCEFIHETIEIKEQQSFMMANNSNFCSHQDSPYASPKHPKSFSTQFKRLQINFKSKS